MTRIRFEDLPSTNTPRNAENLNKLNNVVISPTEPTTGEEVWIQKGKNLFNKDAAINSKFGFTTGSTTLLEDGTIKATSNYASGAGPGQIIKCKKNTDYVISFNVNSFEISGLSAVICYGIDTAGNTHLIFTKTFTTTGAYSQNFNSGVYDKILLSFNGVFDGETLSSRKYVIYDNVQLEQGKVATAFEQFINKKIHTKNDNDVYEEFNDEQNLQIYSTKEQKIGTWIDGKTIYRQVQSFETVTEQTTGTVITDLDQLVNLTGMGYSASFDQWYKFPNAHTNMENYYINVLLTGNAPQIRLGTNHSLTKVYVIIEYTKTTD